VNHLLVSGDLDLSGALEAMLEDQFIRQDQIWALQQLDVKEPALSVAAAVVAVVGVEEDATAYSMVRTGPSRE
jgi:hypothetical protein